MRGFFERVFAVVVYMLAGFLLACLYRGALDLSTEASLTIAFSGLILGMLVQQNLRGAK